jgi:hypothetical protein
MWTWVWTCTFISWASSIYCDYWHHVFCSTHALLWILLSLSYTAWLLNCRLFTCVYNHLLSFLTHSSTSYFFRMSFTHTLFHTLIFLIFLVMWSSPNYSISYNLLIISIYISPFRSLSLQFCIPINFSRRESHFLPLSILILDPFNLQIHSLNQDIPVLSNSTAV